MNKTYGRMHVDNVKTQANTNIRSLLKVKTAMMNGDYIETVIIIYIGKRNGTMTYHDDISS